MIKIRQYLKYTAVALLFPLAAFFASCDGVIFDTIRDEVKLTDAQISGDVYSLARHTSTDNREYLFVSLGKIYKKDVHEATTSGNGTDLDEELKGYTTSSVGNWVQVEKPGLTATTISSNYNTSSAENELYLLSLKWESVDSDGENEPIDRTLYWSNDDGKTWAVCTYADSGDNVVVSVTNYNQKSSVFGTNSVKKEHRAAFANLKGTVYRLNGGTATDISSDTSSYIYSAKDLSELIGAATFDGTVFYFTKNYAMTSNENYNDDATILYYATGSTVSYRKSGDADWSSEMSVSGISSINSIAYVKGRLLAGTSSGLDNVVLGTEGDALDIPTGSSGTISANATSTLSSYYEVKTVLAIDPSKTDTTTDLYGSTDFDGTSSSTSATFPNVGLWAYYVERGKWNRE